MLSLVDYRGCELLYEVRDYHYRPDLWEDYTTWATS